jgi:hypothetical protein
MRRASWISWNFKVIFVQLFVGIYLWHDGNSLRVDGTQVRVLEETDQVRFRGLLQCEHSRRLETEVSLVVLSNLADKTLEGLLANQQLRGLLVAADFTKRNGS